MYSYKSSYTDRIYPGVSAVSVALGGKTREEARTALQSRLIASNPQSGAHYVRLHSRAASSVAFSIVAHQLSFGILSVTPNKHGNAIFADPRYSNLVGAGYAIIAVNGAGFLPSSTVKLMGSAAVSATSVLFRDANTLCATIPMSNPTGIYDVVAQNGASTATLPGAFTIDVAQFTTIQMHLSTPRYIRVGTPNDIVEGVIAFDYENVGNLDAAAPLMVLYSPNVNFRLPEWSTYVTDTIELLAIHHTGAAGVPRQARTKASKCAFRRALSALTLSTISICSGVGVLTLTLTC